MVLFVCPSNEYIQKVMVPMNRVFNIVATDCSIIINYDAGELIWLDGDKYEKKIETLKVTFDSPDEVDKLTRQFYKAVANRSEAFFIGNIEEKKNS